MPLDRLWCIPDATKLCVLCSEHTPWLRAEPGPVYSKQLQGMGLSCASVLI